MILLKYLMIFNYIIMAKYSFNKLKDSYIYNVNNNHYINDDFDMGYE